MKKSKVQYDRIVGIDTSKDWFDTAFGSEDDEVARYKRDEKGIRGFVGRVAKIEGKVLVVIEATGGLERKIANALAKAGIETAVVNPKRIRDFAKANGQFEKTDRLDALMIALFGERIDLLPTTPREKSSRCLLGLVRRRQDLVEILASEKNRLASAEDREIAGSLRKHIRWLEKEKDKLQDKISEMIEADQELSRKRDILTSMVGVGEVTADTLLAELPELGSLDRKGVAKLVGVAPMVKQSGKYKGKSVIVGGRTTVRNSLYMPALCAKKFNPTLKEFYDRLYNNGKDKMVAIVAVMRKMLTILNAMIRDDRHFSTIQT